MNVADLRRTLRDLMRDARAVLKENWIGQSTKPAPDLYPHQWNWDSGFIAIGYAREDPQRGMTELSTLFDAQWDNGMVPQIVFDPSTLGGYFPEPDFWQCHRSPDAPGEPPTSGITQPPVHATAARAIFEQASESDQEAVRAWLHDLLPRIKEAHLYFYRERDPDNEGLVYIRHPWESGLDNSPAWDPPLHRIDPDQVPVPDYQREDLEKDIPEEQRPSDRTYDRYVHLVDLFRRHEYNESQIQESCPFLVQDPMFNAILSRANQDLFVLADEIDLEVDELRSLEERTQEQIRTKLWHDEKKHFDPYDLVAEQHIDVRTSADFFPLYCGAASQTQAKQLYQHLESSSFCAMHQDNCFSIPNYNMEGDAFARNNYWRGPVWINVNWMLMKGLFRYGFDQKARAVREDILELISRFGFHEYFDPHEGCGYGTDQFSWSAALFLDVAHDLMEELDRGTLPINKDLCGS